MQHMGPIRDIDSNGTMIASASEDKTIKLWSAETGDLIKTLRVPITKGDGGKLYAVSLDSNGAWVAAAGSTSGETRPDIGIYVLDTVTDAILWRIPNLPQVVLGLCSSKDGRFLAATLGGTHGLRVYDAKNKFQEIYSDTGYKGSSYSCDFDTSGNLATSSYDGKIRLYPNSGANYKLGKVIQSSAGKQPFSVKFNHKGDRIAIGFSDLPVLEVRDASDLSLLYQPDAGDLDNGSLSQVAWANNDQRLYAGARYKDSEGIRQLVYWDRAGRAPSKSWVVTSDSILAIQSIGASKVVLGTAAKSLFIFDVKGAKLVEQIASSADMRGKLGNNFLVSEDGSSVSFSLDLAGSQLVSFDTNQRKVEFSHPRFSHGARTTSNVASIDNWLNSQTPSIDDTKIKLEDHDVSRSLAIDKSDEYFLLGTEHSLKYLQISGQLMWESDVPATAWGVNISADNKLAVVAYGDGSIRWHRLRDGELLLSLFIYNQGKDWVLWSQSGYYDASPGADRLIGWHKNNGATKSPDFFTANQLRHRFYRPDIVSQILTTLDEAKAIAAAPPGPEDLPVIAKPIAESLPPVVTLLSPVNGSSFTNSDVTLRYRLDSSVQAGANKVSILVDGRPLKRDRGLARGDATPKYYDMKVVLPNKDLTLAIVVENDNGVSSPSSVRLKWGGKKEDLKGKPRLFVLAAGVSDYQHKDIPDLEYAVKDALDFKQVIQGQTGRGLYQEVIVRALKNPKQEEVKQGLAWLKAQVTRNDVAIFYIAGHGLNDDKKQYFFITNETDPYNLDTTALSYKAIRDTLINLPSKTIAFVDTCQSGNALGNDILASDLNGVVNDLSATENGVIVFTSSTSSQPSMELSSIKNGVFTHTILEGLRDGGTIDRYFTQDGKLTFKELDLHISNRVRKLTNNKQNPTLVTPNDTTDYVIARVTAPSDE